MKPFPAYWFRGAKPATFFAADPSVRVTLYWTCRSAQGLREESIRAPATLVLFLTRLLTIPLAGQRLFDTLLLARLQVKRMTFDLFDNVFGLNLALEAAERVFEGLSLLNSNLCQCNTPLNRAGTAMS